MGPDGPSVQKCPSVQKFLAKCSDIPADGSWQYTRGRHDLRVQTAPLALKLGAAG